MKILLSPAKSIDEKSQIFGECSIPFFEEDAQKLVRKLKRLKSSEIMNLMSVSVDIAQLNVHRFNTWTNADLNNKENHFQAIRAFNGEVYRGFDIASLPEEKWKYLNNQILILSGLYGCLKPFDLISPYRLEMGTKFSPDTKSKNLYDYWKLKVTKALSKEMQLDETIINLASHEYFKVIDQKKIKSRIITPVFKEFKNGKYTIVMMYAKHARGAMARYIIDQSISIPEELKAYNIDGYSFDDKSSTENEWVFIR